jgi:cystathionine beta-lyase family protein involved in aluminum resistance
MHANSTVDTKLEQVLPSLEILSIKRSFGSYWRITVDLADINTKLFKTLQNIDESAQGNFLFT